MLFGLTDIIEL